MNKPEQLKAFWSALPDASASFWMTEFASIEATANRAAELERQAAEFWKYAEEEAEELGRRMLAQAHREWPETDVENALKEVA